MTTFQAFAMGLALLAAGCDNKTAPVAAEGQPAKPGEAAAVTAPAGKAVDAALRKAGIEFTTKDKTAASKSLLAGGEAMVSYTEYRFSGNSVILLVAEFSDVSKAPALSEALEGKLKELATTASLEYSKVPAMKDQHFSAFCLAKASDGAAKAKVLSAVSE